MRLLFTVLLPVFLIGNPITLAQQPLHKVIILTPQTQPELQEMAKQLSIIAVNHSRSLQGVQSIGQNELSLLLDEKRNTQLQQCNQDTTCLADIAASVGADTIIWGRIDKHGRVYEINLNAVDVNHVSIRNSSYRNYCGSQKNLDTQMKDAVNALWGLAPQEQTSACSAQIHEVSALMGNYFTNTTSRTLTINKGAPLFQFEYAYIPIPSLAVIIQSRGSWHAEQDTELHFTLWSNEIGFKYYFSTFPVKGYFGATAGVSSVWAKNDLQSTRSASMSGSVMTGILWTPTSDAWGFIFDTGYFFNRSSSFLLQNKSFGAFRLTTGVMLRL